MIESNVSRETHIRLDAFRAEFTRWSTRMNLVSGAERGRLDERHIADSLQLMAIRPPTGRWFDIGTGGGFPGAILAAAEPEHGAEITLVESNLKKAAFLRTVCTAMGARARVLAERAERVIGREEAPDTVSARALASLPDLLAMLEPWLSARTIGLFPKGRRAAEELAAARKKWTFDCEAHPSRTADDAVILEIANLSPRS